MRRAMVATHSGKAARLRSVLHLPAGEAAITLRGADGRLLWARTLEVRGRVLVEATEQS